MIRRRDGITANDKPAWRAGVNQALGWEWKPYSPILTASTSSPTGFDTVAAWYQVGSLVTVRLTLTGGTSVNAGSGTYRIALPVNAASGQTAGIGTLLMFEASSHASGVAEAYPADPTYVTLAYPATYGGTLTAVGASAPWAWTTGDIIRGTLTYEAALPA